MTPPKLNAEWHHAHPMSPRATLDQRVAWHLEHQAHCACRGLPGSIRRELERRRAAGERAGRVE